MRTGVTVLVTDAPYPAAADVRGGAPGTTQYRSARSGHAGGGHRCASRSPAARPSGSMRCRASWRACARKAAASRSAPGAPQGADRRRRHPVRSRQWRQQGLGRGRLLSRAGRGGGRESAAQDFALGNAGAGLARWPAPIRAAPAARRAVTDDGFTVGALVSRQFGGFAAHSRHRSVLGLSVRAERRIRRPRARRVRCPKSQIDLPPDMKGARAQRQHHHRHRRDRCGAHPCGTEAARHHGGGRLCACAAPGARAVRRRHGVRDLHRQDSRLPNPRPREVMRLGSLAADCLSHAPSPAASMKRRRWATRKVTRTCLDKGEDR